MQKKLGLLPLCLLMGGCVSSSDFAATQLQVNQLTQKVNALENTVQGLQESVKQRVIRVPTGSPTRIAKRSANQASNFTEENSYQSAVQAYESGDMNTAVTAFNQFISTYPNSSRRADALFYVGQAYYAQRNYEQAILPLEALVAQAPHLANPRAVDLLKRLYQLTNRSEKSAGLTPVKGLN